MESRRFARMLPRLEGLSFGERLSLEHRRLRTDFIEVYISLVGTWNKLPEEVIEAGAITTFKSLLDGYMYKKGLVISGCVGW